MRIFFWPYLLQPKTSLNAVSQGQARPGVLIKIETSEGQGFADLHPWTEFGDASVNEQLRFLKEGKPSSLAQRSLELATKDLRARAENRQLIPSSLRNNFLVSRLSDVSFDKIYAEGFRTLKIKAGRDVDFETKFIERVASETEFRLRVDFNSTMTEESFARWSQGLSNAAKKAIDYVEDPFLYQPEAWRERRKNLKLALDFEGRDLSFNSPIEADVLIYKPARENSSRMAFAAQQGLNITVTSMMDHPVGVMHALVCAEEISERVTLTELGCATLNLYEPTAFSQSLRQVGAFFESIPGLGIGFDDLFVKLDWQNL